MNNFKDFGIKPQTKNFEGDKIKIDRIINRPIIIHDFKIEKSKFERGSGQCLYLQVMLDGEKRVIFTGSVKLMDMIQQVPESKFPFETTVVKNNGLEFT